MTKKQKTDNMLSKDKIWFEDKDKLIEFAGFLVESEELNTAKELLYYLKHPYMYAEAYALYQSERLWDDNKEEDQISITDIDKLVIVEEVKDNRRSFNQINNDMIGIEA